MREWERLVNWLLYFCWFFCLFWWFKFLFFSKNRQWSPPIDNNWVNHDHFFFLLSWKSVIVIVRQYKWYYRTHKSLRLNTIVKVAFSRKKNNNNNERKLSFILFIYMRLSILILLFFCYLPFSHFNRLARLETSVSCRL